MIRLKINLSTDFDGMSQDAILESIDNFAEEFHSIIEEVIDRLFDDKAAAYEDRLLTLCRTGK